MVKYGPGNANTAFVSGIRKDVDLLLVSISFAIYDSVRPAGEENKHVVLLGGLGDGLLLAP